LWRLKTAWASTNPTQSLNTAAQASELARQAIDAANRAAGLSLL
jgi:nitrite reductase (cytochrome c-552)